MIITKKEWDYILKQPIGSCFNIKVDFGLKEINVCIDKENIIFSGINTINREEKIKDNFCYLINDNKIEPLAYFSDSTNRFYKLTPTNDWPTLSIGSVPMHKLSSPKSDTENKISLLKPYGYTLDTCMGLGYSAILASKYAKVITFEKDENVYALAKLNPVSEELFFSGNIEVRQADISSAIKEFGANYFDCIMHDPPTFKLAPELFGAAFYAELYRVLKNGGRLFHYTPFYKISQGYDFPSKIREKLKKTGFKLLEFSPDRGGIVCKK
ncbi:MAG: methyltransferase domain-containing protein [Candidatus Omnitrophota bacterium]